HRHRHGPHRRGRAERGADLARRLNPTRAPVGSGAADDREVLLDEVSDLGDLLVTFRGLEVAAARLEVLDELRSDRWVGTEDLANRGSDARRDLGQVVTVEVEEADVVLAEHEPELVLGDTLERVLQPLPRVR